MRVEYMQLGIRARITSPEADNKLEYASSARRRLGVPNVRLDAAEQKSRPVNAQRCP